MESRARFDSAVAGFGSSGQRSDSSNRREKVLADEYEIELKNQRNQLATSPLYTEFIRLNYARVPDCGRGGTTSISGRTRSGDTPAAAARKIREFSELSKSAFRARLGRNRWAQQYAHHHRRSRKHRLDSPARRSCSTNPNRRSKSKPASSLPSAISCATSAFSSAQILSTRLIGAASRRDRPEPNR